MRDRPGRHADKACLRVTACARCRRLHRGARAVGDRDPGQFSPGSGSPDAPNRGPVVLRRQGGPAGRRSSVSIYDDARSRDGGCPLRLRGGAEAQGGPGRRRGLPRGGYDRRTGKETASIHGHGLPPPTPTADPLNLFMGTGRCPLDEMIRSTERGLLVSRFHYSNVVNPVESSITGMTRDGTFLIEGARSWSRCGTSDSRSRSSALSRASRWSVASGPRERVLLQRLRVPALKVDGFHFSGVSDH